MRKKPSNFRAVLRRAALPAAALTVMAFFGAYAILGPNGVLAYGDYQRQLATKTRQYAAIDAKRERLKTRVALLDPGHSNPDLVEELVRKDLNVVHPDDMIFSYN